jgi:trk system potassium uptake protein TrkH
MRRLKPPHIIILSFLGAILLGSVLLSLPIATHEGDNVPLVDRIFTATSAACVTGLVVKDTAAWAPFGRVIIMLLFQAGGLGIMTFSILFAILLGRKITISENLVMKGTIGHRGPRNLRKLTLYIVGMVFVFEAIGAALLFIRWNIIGDWSVGANLYNSVFHAISAFCNAGFSLFRRSFTGFSGDPYINLIMISLIFTGGIGFMVILDIGRLGFWSKDKRPILSRMSVQTKMALSVSLFLIIIGGLVIFLLEKDNTLARAGAGTRFLGPFFQAVTSRTAGFNTLPIGKLAPPTLIFLIFLMFIGASPGSTGGGIKTCTFGVLIASAIAMIKNRERVWVFRKTVPKTVIRKALVIFILALGWIFLFSLALSVTEKGHIFGKDYYLRILFETTSAFGTVGLSTGITSMLSGLGKILIIITMFVGRIGPLTMALAVALQEEKLLYNYPEEQVMVG